MMKRLLSLLFVGILLVSLLSSCERASLDGPTLPSTEKGTEGNSELPSSDGGASVAPLTGGNFDRKFSEYLDRENFVRAFTQGGGVGMKYKHEGEFLHYLVKGAYYDGIFKDGYSCGFIIDGEEEVFGYTYDAGIASDELKYYDRFYTHVPLEGLNLPFDVAFEDELDTVFQKIGIRIDPYSEFIPDEDGGDQMTLFRGESASLVFERHVDSYTLLYSETNPNATSKHGQRTVTRTLKLSFSGEGDKLGYFEVCVNDHDLPIPSDPLTLGRFPYDVLPAPSASAEQFEKWVVENWPQYEDFRILYITTGTVESPAHEINPTGIRYTYLSQGQRQVQDVSFSVTYEEFLTLHENYKGGVVYCIVEDAHYLYRMTDKKFPLPDMSEESIAILKKALVAEWGDGQ